MLGAGIAAVVKPVELERLHQVADIGLGGGDLGVVCPVQHIGHDERSQHTDDEQHHHQFDEGEAALEGLEKRCFCEGMVQGVVGRGGLRRDESILPYKCATAARPCGRRGGWAKDEL